MFYEERRTYKHSSVIVPVWIIHSLYICVVEIATFETYTLSSYFYYPKFWGQLRIVIFYTYQVIELIELHNFQGDDFTAWIMANQGIKSQAHAYGMGRSLYSYAQKSITIKKIAHLDAYGQACVSG